jgi:hypothetical protein
MASIRCFYSSEIGAFHRACCLGTQIGAKGHSACSI